MPLGERPGRASEERSNEATMRNASQAEAGWTRGRGHRELDHAKPPEHDPLQQPNGTEGDANDQVRHEELADRVAAEHEQCAHGARSAGRVCAHNADRATPDAYGKVGPQGGDALGEHPLETVEGKGWNL